MLNHYAIPAYMGDYHAAALEAKYLKKHAAMLGVMILSYLLIMNLVTPYIYLIVMSTVPVFGWLTEGVLRQLAGMAAYIIALGAPLLIYRSLVSIPWRQAIPVQHTGFINLTASGFLTLGSSIVGMYASNALYELLSYVDLVPQYPVEPTPMSGGTIVFILYVINIAVLPALIEEFIFRGVVLQSLRRFGDGFAILISSLLFGLVHLNFIQTPNAFVLGLVLGYLVVKTGSIWVGVLGHFLNNFLSVAQETVVNLMPEAYSDMIYWSFTVLYLLLGFLGLLMFCLRDKNIFNLHPAGYTGRGSVGGVFFSSVTFIITLILMIGLCFLNAVV